MSDQVTFPCDLTVREYLYIHILRKYGSQTECAKALGMPRTALCASLNGHRKLPPALLADAGLTIRQLVVSSSASPTTPNPERLT